MFCMQSSPARPRDICMPGEQARSETGFTSHLSWPTFFCWPRRAVPPRVRFTLLLQKPSLEKEGEGEGPSLRLHCHNFVIFAAAEEIAQVERGSDY